jgi:hypothetical protein
MTFLTLSIAALSLASPLQSCSLHSEPQPEPRVFTNADLERMAACRYQTGAQSEPRSDPPERVRPAPRNAKPPSRAERDPSEADWRAQWRSVDQKARRLRREARELRQEAGEAPRDPKKKAVGRRSPSLLLARARSLEDEAKELEDEFQERARRAGALPGWLRPKGR